MTVLTTALTQNINSHYSHAIVKTVSEKEEVTKVITAFRSVMDFTALLPPDVRDKICDYLLEPSYSGNFYISSQFILNRIFPCCNTHSWPTFGIVDEQTLPDVFDADWRSCERGSPQYCIHTMNAAIFRNNILIIHHIVFRARSLLQSRDERGWTPLVASILLRKYEAAQTLLDLGADPSFPSECNGRFDIPQGAPPVWIAAAKIKNLRFVELLVSYMRT